MRFPLLWFLVVIIALGFSAEAWAHPGHPHPVEEVDEFDDEAFMSALVHPFTGLDHLVVMLAVGAASFLSRRLLGTCFLGAMSVGVASGFASPTWLLALSVAMAGSLLLLKDPGPAKTWQWVLVAVIGFWQGGGHGAQGSSLEAGMGLFVGTAAGIWLGAAVARLLQARSSIATSIAGASVVVAGLSVTVIRLFPG